MIGPAAIPTCAGGSPSAGTRSTISSDADTAPSGSRKWNITPSPSHFTGRPRCPPDASRTTSASAATVCAAASSPRSSVSRVYPTRSRKQVAGLRRREAGRSEYLLDERHVRAGLRADLLERVLGEPAVAVPEDELDEREREVPFADRSRQRVEGDPALDERLHQPDDAEVL